MLCLTLLLISAQAVDRVGKWKPVKPLTTAASNPLPTQAQLEWSYEEQGVLVSWGMSTTLLTGIACPNKAYPVNQFWPNETNFDQWMEAIVAFGAKYAVLTVQDGCGYILWKTNATFPSFNFNYTYGVGQPGAYPNDLFRGFVDACTRYGVKPGIYYGMGQNSWCNIRDQAVTSNASAGQANLTLDQYKQVVFAQMTELLTAYGPIYEIWLDGGYFPDMADALAALFIQYQPQARVFNGFGITQNPIRWIGTEDGIAPDPNWSTGDTYGAGDPNSVYWNPAEIDFTLQAEDTWYWNPTMRLRTFNELWRVYHTSVGHNGNMFLDVAPDNQGLIPSDAFGMYKEIGNMIRGCYSTPIISGMTVGIQVVLPLPFPNYVDRFVIQEDQTYGQLVRNYTVEIMVSGSDNWLLASEGSSIGNKKIDLLNSTTAKMLVTSARLTLTNYIKGSTSPLPNIKNFALYFCGV